MSSWNSGGIDDDAGARRDRDNVSAATDEATTMSVARRLLLFEAGSVCAIPFGGIGS